MTQLQFKNQECWISTQKVEGLRELDCYEDIQKLLKNTAYNLDLTPFIEAYKNVVHTLHPITRWQVNYITIPSRATGKLNNAYDTKESVGEHLDSILAFLKEWLLIVPQLEAVSKVLIKHYNISYHSDSTLTQKERNSVTLISFVLQGFQQDVVGIKTLEQISKIELLIKNVQEVKSMFTSGKLVHYQSSDTDYVEKTAWAIFAQKNNESGYTTKKGDVGEISSARLFDTLKDAQKTGSRVADAFEVMEVKISLKKRCDVQPEFKNQKMLAALAYIERTKIDNSLSDTVALKKRNKL